MTFEPPILRRDDPDRIARATRRETLPPAASPVPPTAVWELEGIETEAWRDLLDGAPQAIRAAAGLELTRIGGVLAASATFDVLAFNRVIGRDPRIAVDRTTLDRLIAHYRALGVRRAFLPWPPPPPGARTGWELDRRGIHLYNRWIKLQRDASPAPSVRSELTAGPLGAAGRDDVARVLAASFDWPAPLPALWASRVGCPGWSHFAARSDGRVVAVAGLLVHGAAAWFGPAATLPEHRARGAQSLLLAERIEAARNAGCRLLVVETAEPTVSRRVTSLRNVQRMGFKIAYRRENYLIQP